MREVRDPHPSSHSKSDVYDLDPYICEVCSTDTVADCQNFRKVKAIRRGEEIEMFSICQVTLFDCLLTNLPLNECVLMCVLLNTLIVNKLVSK